MTPERPQRRKKKTSITASRWQQLERLFQGALELDPADRAAFLDEACAGDDSLRAEVEILISADEKAANFIEPPAYNATNILNTDPGLLAGQHINHYRIVNQIGVGAMGEVYLAQDTRLGRRVALKLLPGDLTKDRARLLRFRREARAASALSHPNILTIHEIGKSDSLNFIVTEYIEGQTLRRHMSNTKMKLGDVLDVAIQVASALSAAHEAGIIHRDVKPENIMLRTDGYVKVLDFGLAKFTERESESEGSTLTTESGILMGTPKYMSPEQARGLDVDARTDIFSLGAVIYEMTAGRPPFEGQTTSDVIASILGKEPPPLGSFSTELPKLLERIVTKALAKEREERYQTAGELLVDLKRIKHRLETEPAAALRTSSAEYLISGIRRRKVVAALAVAILVVLAGGAYFIRYGMYSSGSPIHSMAVLPFVNASGDPDLEYLSEGITEDIINSLSKLPGLRVLSSSAVLRYKGSAIDPLEIGSDLNIDALLTGRIQRRGGALIISAELTGVNQGSHLWGDRYELKSPDVFTVQERISSEISRELRLKLTGEEQKRLTRRHTDNVKAYELYLRGRHSWNKQTKEAMEKAGEYFNRAIEEDPNFALAYAGLADSYVLGLVALPPTVAMTKARAAALKALEMDDALAEAHAALARIKLNEWDWLGAVKDFERAAELDPGSAIIHHQRAKLLAKLGRLEEALAELGRALETDPLSLVINADLGKYLYLARRYDQAIDQCRRTLEIDDYGWARLWLGRAYESKGMYSEAIEELQKATLLEDAPRILAGLAHAYAVSGNRARARKVLDELGEISKRRYINSYDMATIYVGLGENDRAFDWLEKAYEERSSSLGYLNIDPLLDSVRSDRRFVDLIRRVGLPH